MEIPESLIEDRSYINGEWVRSVSGKTFDVLNPATGELIRAVADLNIDQIRSAIDAAHAAFPGWSRFTAKERSTFLRTWFGLIMQSKESLATLITMECGKPLEESRAEVAYGASFIEWYAEEAKRVYGDVIPPHTPDRRLMVIKQPVGVAAVITPWNFPLAMVTRKLGPALAAGCSVILKPPGPAPLTSLAIARLAEKAGIPPGVLNIVTTSDSASAGQEFCTNGKIRKISFTGSTETGRKLLGQSASTVKKVSMELGGNAPFIVFEDADIDAAVKGAVASKYRNSGQTCVCVNRVLVHEKIYDEFVQKLADEVSNLKTGNGLDEGVMIGPLINESGLKKVKELVADALQKGARIAIGGKALSGLFFEPTVLAGATPAMRLSQEEIFGPVAPVFTFSNEEEAVKMANDTIFGLAAYFYSKDVTRCWRVAEKLEYGMIGINEGIISTEAAPFGGVKQSGLGREGSKYGIEEYLEIKYMCYGGM